MILVNISWFMFIWMLCFVISFQLGIMLDLKVRYILAFPTIVASVVVIFLNVFHVYGMEGW